MKRVQMLVESLDGPSALVRREDDAPQPGPGEVLVAVRAAGCNFFDTLITRGQYQVKPPLPFAPGAELAGDIVAVGAGVTGFKVGDRVAGLAEYGAFASHIVLPTERVFRMPDEMSYDVAAAMGIVYQTSYFALRYRADLQPGETLLVHAAAGGVGLAAVQIGRALGATVIGTAGSDDKLALAREHGAQHTFTYRDDAWKDAVLELTGGKGADVIYDPVGGDAFDLSTKCIAFSGRLLVIGFAGGRIPTLAMNRVLLKNFSVVGLHWGAYFKHDPALIARAQQELFDLWREQRIMPLVSSTHPLTDAAQALADLGGRQTVGKVVLHP
ncbi:MAG: NADPH:quinone oxidoreductase family protein [Polyangiales bacterium]|nr:NADPH:quinone oxidoreductase family protein [Myxococcales bacterium]